MQMICYNLQCRVFVKEIVLPCEAVMVSGQRSEELLLEFSSDKWTVWTDKWTDIIIIIHCNAVLRELQRYLSFPHYCIV